MSHRTSLPIVLEQEVGDVPTATAGLARAVLPEVCESLGRLATSNITSAIDLRSLPMTDADREELATLLGRGEVSITVSVAGDSEVWETSYQGVWWVRHRGVDGDVLSEFIEIADVPAIVVAHSRDIQRSHNRMVRFVRGQPSGGSLND